MIKIELSTHINKPTQDVFDFIAILSNYTEWLEGGETYVGTQQTSLGPAGVGTTYIDKSGPATMHGEIIEYQSPTRITFRQGMKLIVPAFEVTMRYTLEDQGDETTKVIRNYQMELYGIVRLTTPWIRTITRKENERILEVMKKRLEAEQ